MKKNDIITSEVYAMTAEGSGICRSDDGMAVFVPNTAVGDVLKVRILKVLKAYAFGKTEEIIKPSAERTACDCPYFSRCGGCVYRHINYGEELRIKTERVSDCIERIGGFLNVEISPIVGAENVLGYRNKAQLPLSADSESRINMGFFAFHSHRVIDCSDCKIQPAIFNKTMALFRKFLSVRFMEIYDENTHSGLLRHLYLRYAQKTDELMICLVINGNRLDCEAELAEYLSANLPELRSLMININTKKTNVILGEKSRVLYGRDYIEDELCGKKFRISPLSFYQVNRDQAEKLYTIAAEYADLKPTDILLDLYCGTGTIGITMADKCKKLIGVEIIPQAIKDAKINAKINGISNAEFICGDSAAAAKKLKNEDLKPDVVVIDPPRKGCDSALIESIAEMSPKRVVYVSCDPSTLARDLKIFDGFGYKIQAVTPVDLFPRTAHVETVCLLSRAEEK